MKDGKRQVTYSLQYQNNEGSWETVFRSSASDGYIQCFKELNKIRERRKNEELSLEFRVQETVIESVILFSTEDERAPVENIAVE